MPAALAVDWKNIQRVAESGVPLPEVAKRYDVDYEAVKKRSLRGDWLLPGRIAAKAKALSRVPLHSSPLEVAAESLLERQKTLTETTHEIVTAMLETVKVSPPAIENTADLERMVKLQRLNLSMDTADSAVNVRVNLWGGAGAVMQGGPVSASYDSGPIMEAVESDEPESWLADELEPDDSIEDAEDIL